MGFVVVALVCVGCGESEVPATVPAMEIVEYTVLDDALDESPGKTQVTMDLLVEDTATESELRDVLHAVYDEVNGRTGFQYHPTPTLVALYIYPTRAHAASGMGQWTAMLMKSPTDDAPRITIDASVGRPDVVEERFRLSVDERKRLFEDLVLAEDRGNREAEVQFATDIQRQIERSEELIDQYKFELRTEYGLTEDELDQVGIEGLLNNWPMP